MAEVGTRRRSKFGFARPEKVVFAVDFGTSNSLLAATDGVVTTDPLPLDPFAQDPTVFRSILYFPDGNTCFYGQRAVEMYGENQAEGRLIRSIKKYLPMESFIGSWIDDRMVRLEDLIGYFLLEMRKRACESLDLEVESIMLGRPAKFSDDPAKDKLAQYRMRKAAEFAGFKRIDFLPEPLAAAFDLRKRLSEYKTVLVVDLGGGTSDFTVIRIGPGAYRDQDLLSMGGISVAGDVIDGEIMKTEIAPWFGSRVRYRVPMGRNILEMPRSLLDHICSPADIAQLRKSDFMAFFRNVREWAVKDEDRQRMERLFVLVDDQLGFQLFEEIDRIKRLLSLEPTARFDFPYPGIEINCEVTQSAFAQLATPAAERILKTMDDTLAGAQLRPEAIDLVYCTGGTAKLALIQEGLLRRFPAEKIVRHSYFHSVIEGLAARAREILGAD